MKIANLPAQYSTYSNNVLEKFAIILFPNSYDKFIQNGTKLATLTLLAFQMQFWYNSVEMQNVCSMSYDGSFCKKL